MGKKIKSSILLAAIIVTSIIMLVGCGNNTDVLQSDENTVFSGSKIEGITETVINAEVESEVLEKYSVIDGAIDVSQHQGNIDFTLIDAPLVVIRLGYSGYEKGYLNVDKKFYDNIEKVSEFKGEIALYWASHSINTDEVANENEFIVNEFSKLPASIRSRIKYIFIDREAIYDPQNKNSDVGRADFITDDCFNLVLSTQVKQLQKMLPNMKIGVYTNIDYFVTKIDITLLGNVPMWIAGYETPVCYTSFENVFAKLR